MYKTKLKSGDTVKVISGKDKGKEGKILIVDRKNGKVIIEGINMVTKHTKPSAANQQGGIVHQEAALNSSKVMYVHKGKPTRLGIKIEKEDRNGRTKNVRYRVAKSTGEVID
ncbi:50S ribosomal protein L24 [Vallitalea sediminicola]